MNVYFDVIKARHSYRGAFLPTPVTRAQIETLLDAGRAAPSACFKQSPRFIAITDPAVMAAVKALPELTDAVVQTARAFILIVYDPTPQHGTHSFGAEDCAAVATNMLNTATALGLASVWLDGVLRYGAGRELDKILNIPAPFSSRILLPLGVPEKPGAQPARKPAEQRVGWNTFTDAMK
ncbi:MAG: nitroreductase family protein [Kiritimatiellaeota bacterium]|nr:nitroreductase family protein [Kiritimatiellota bacterium]